MSYVRVLGKYSDGVGEFGNGFVNYQVEHLYIYRVSHISILSIVKSNHILLFFEHDFVLTLRFYRV